MGSGPPHVYKEKKGARDLKQLYLTISVSGTNGLTCFRAKIRTEIYFLTIFLGGVELFDFTGTRTSMIKDGCSFYLKDV
jgi:hypothetical protein